MTSCSKVNGIIDSSRIENGLKQTYTSSDAEYIIQIDNESKAYAEHIHNLLPEHIKFDPNHNVFAQIKDGIILAHVLNSIQPNCIDLNKLTRINGIIDKKYKYEATTNLGIVLQSASQLGIKLVNIGPEDILYENKNLVLGLLWQIVRLSVSKLSSIRMKPELLNLRNKSENIDEMALKSPEELCLRWLNFHLQNAKHNEFYRKVKEFIDINRISGLSDSEKNNELHNVFKKCYVTNNDETNSYGSNAMLGDYWTIPEKCLNFSTSLKDSRVLLLIFSQIIPNVVTYDELLSVWFMCNNVQRAEKVIEIAARIDCNKFMSVDSIINGDHRLNFLFCQTMMNKYTGIDNKLVDIDELEARLGNYENNITTIKDNLQAISNEMAEKEEKRIIKEKENKQLYKSMETKSQEYEHIIEDLKTSFDSFSRRVNEYVEETLDITLPTDFIDPKERLWATTMKLLAEIKVLKSERNSALSKVASLKEDNLHFEDKIKELEDVLKVERELKNMKKSSFFTFCGC